MNRPVIIIGAGPAGIGAALALGDTATVLEAQQEVAGLSRTITVDGAIFDLGGHSFHTPHPDIRRLVFDALEMEEQRREAWVWMGGDWIHYPFQKHYHEMTQASARLACENGLATTGNWQSAGDFDEYLSLRFGEGIADHFMRPYNRKLWGVDLQRMEANWTGERVAGPKGAAEQFRSTGGERKPLQADTTVSYPSRGGFGEIFRALACRIHSLQLGESVVSIDPLEKILTTARGEKLAWKNIISTLPLPGLLRLLPDVPLSIVNAAAQLEALAVMLVMVTLDGQIDTARQRVYIPGPEMPGHKIVLNNTSSRWLRSSPFHGIQVEVSETSEAAQHYRGDRAALASDVVAGLLRMGLIPRADMIRRTEVMPIPNGYPVPTHHRRRIVDEIRHWLEDKSIFIAGRFGEWAYINSDEALHRGVCLGTKLAAAT